jgi:hypothetical protein
MFTNQLKNSPGTGHAGLGVRATIEEEFLINDYRNKPRTLNSRVVLIIENNFSVTLAEGESKPADGRCTGLRSQSGAGHKAGTDRRRIQDPVPSPLVRLNRPPGDVPDWLDKLITLLRNLLKQSTKVDSIVLVVPNQELASTLNMVDLIKATCVIQKVGGLSIVFKESGEDTVLLFVNNDAFDDFHNNQHLQRCLTEPNQRGILRLANRDLSIDINHVFQR